MLWINSTGWIPFSLGVLQHNGSNYEEAIDYFDWAIKANPNWAEAYDYRAQARVNLNAEGTHQNLDLAIADANKAIALDPTRSNFYETRAEAYRAAEKFKEAIGDYSKRLNMAAGDGAGAHGTSADALDTEQSLLESRAEVYEKLGDWEKAQDDRQKLIDQYTREIADQKSEPKIEQKGEQKKDSFENSPVEHSPYQDIADQYVRLGEFDKAMHNYALAIGQLSAACVDRAYASRGDLEFRLGKYKDALNDYDKAISLTANSAQDDDQKTELAANYYGRIRVYMKRKEYEKALADCDKLVDLDAQDSYKALRANVYDKLGQHEQANADREEVLEPYEAAVKEEATDTAYNDRGVAHEDVGQYSKALQDYLQAIKLSPKESMYLSNGARMYGRLGNHEKALEMFARAISADTTQADKSSDYASIAQDQIKAGHAEAAVAAASKGLQLDASNQEAYHWRSEAYKMLGQFEAAQSDFKSAVRFDYDEQD